MNLKTDQVGGLIGIPFLTAIGHSGSIPYFAGFYPTFACLKLKTSSWAIFLRFAGHEKHNQLRAAYSYWNVANTVPLQAAGWADFST